MARMINVEGATGTIPVLRAAPERPGPGLVIVPSIYGVGQDVVAHAAHFAAKGALVWVIDPFWRSAPGALAHGDPAALLRRRQHAPSDGHADTEALLGAIREDPLCRGSLFVLGICFGGRFAFTAAADGLVAGAAAWHGGGLGALLGRAEDICVPLSLDFGESDPLIPLHEVQAIREAFAGRPEVEIRSHPGAGHGFSHTGVPGVFDASATAAAVAGVERMLGAGSS